MPTSSEKSRAKARAYYSRNREQILAKAAVYRRLNRERLAVEWKRYYQSKKAELYKKKKAYIAVNPEKLRNWKRADYRRNRDAYLRRAAAQQRTTASKIKQAQRYIENKEAIRARQREYQERNRKKLADYQRRYRTSQRGRELRKASDQRTASRAAAYKVVWAQRNREKINQRFCIYVRERVKSDPAFAIRLRLRSRLISALSRHMQGTPQRVTATVMALLGCSLDDLMRHLGSMFLPGMSWDNRSEWHIDHIKPLCAFDLTEPDQRGRIQLYQSTATLGGGKFPQRWTVEGTAG